MKNKFLNASIQLLKKSGNYTGEQIEIIVYGLEGVYLTFTKMLVLFFSSYILGEIKEFVFLLISYNIIRSQAFGIHASKSVYCLLSSFIMFIGGAFLCKYLVFPFWFSLISSIISLFCLFFYAPADTYKRPIINQKKRRRFKFLSCLFGSIYILLIIVFKESIWVNYLVLGLIEAVLMILPISYHIFHLPYANYKNYVNGV